MTSAPTPAQIVYISFSAEINADTTESLLSYVAQVVNQGVRRVYLLLSTPGGTLMHGLTVYNVLRGLPILLTTHNVGSVNSIGNMVFLAGNPRYSCPHSTFMFHGMESDATQGTHFEEESPRDKIRRVRSNQARVCAIIEERTRLGRNEIEAMLGEGQTKDAAFALRFGIIDDIRDIDVPIGAPVFQFAFQRRCN